VRYRCVMRPSTRATIAREAVANLCESSIGPLELLYEASELVRSVVPCDSHAWFTIDPHTLLPTCYVAIRRASFSVAIARNEAHTPDLHKYGELAGRSYPVAALSGVDEATAETSARRTEIFRPEGMGDELRVALRANGACWGGGCLMRAAEARPFDIAEGRFVAEVADTVGQALRRSLARRATVAIPALAPGMVLLDEDLHIVSATQEARQWMERLPTYPELSIAVAAIAAGAPGRADVSPRLPLRDGGWLRVNASILPGAEGEPDRTAVMLEPAQGTELTSLLMLVHGLSDREREVVELLLRGLPTEEVAARLCISRHTLRDHIKATFAKVGVVSRPQLTALLGGEPLIESLAEAAAA
jgi:DNA-binding CsgD family transcriptional regulator